MQRLARTVRTLAAVTLVACGGAELRSMQFRGPDGSPDWWSISCRGDSALCWRESGEVCPHGYDIIDRTNRDEVHAKTVVGGGGGYAPVVSHTRMTTVSSGEMTIRCTGPSVARPAVDPNCKDPGSWRSSFCPQDEDAQPRHFLAEDPRERDAGA